MNLADQVGVTQIELVIATIDIDTLGIKHRAHSAVEHVNGIGVEEVFEVWHGPKILTIYD
jgi:hypothetical protein